MSRFSRKRTARAKSLPKKNDIHSKRRIRSIAALWADDNDEFSVYCEIANRMMNEDKKSDVHVKSYFVEKEVNKCIDCGLVENGSNLAAMLTSQDREMSILGMEIVYDLREKRLNSKTR